MKTKDLIKACLLVFPLFLVPAAHAAVTQEPATAASVERGVRQVNINTADAPSIADALQGIGLRKAEAIVAYRNEHGPFKSVDELVNVKGIGAKTLEQLRPRVSL